MFVFFLCEPCSREAVARCQNRTAGDWQWRVV